MKTWQVSWLLSIGLFAGLLSPAVGLELPSWVQRVDVQFEGPDGRGAVTLSGQWTDTCVPDTIQHTRIGNVIHVEVTQPGIDTVCGLAITPWTLREEFGPLESPIFSIQGSLIAVNPRDRDQRQPVAGPDWLANFPPPKPITFQGLGSLGAEAYVSAAFETSARGRVVVGHNQLAPNAAGFITQEAFAWTPSTRMFPLGILPGGIPGGSTAYGVSGDGNTIVGASSAAQGRERAFVWNLGTGMTELPTIYDFATAKAEAASWNGNVIVGSETFAGPALFGLSVTNAVRWTGQGGAQHLGQLYPNGNAWAQDVSADGEFIVGTSTPNPFLEAVNLDISQAFLWTEAKGMVGLGHLPSLRIDASAIPSKWESTASAISASGKFVVGSSLEYMALGDPRLVAGRGYIWNADTGMHDLGIFDPSWGQTRRVTPVDVSGDGRFVVGSATVQVGPPGSDAPEKIVPFLWERGRGLRSLDEVLRDWGTDSSMQGWQLFDISAISADGTTLVGTGINPQGIQEAWRLQFDRPALSPGAKLGDLNNDGTIDAADAGILFAAWGKADSLAPADLNEDGFVDAADAEIVFTFWTQTPDIAAPQLAAIPEPNALALLVLAAGCGMRHLPRKRRFR